MMACKRSESSSSVASEEGGKLLVLDGRAAVEEEEEEEELEEGASWLFSWRESIKASSSMACSSFSGALGGAGAGAENSMGGLTCQSSGWLRRYCCPWS